MIIFNGHKKYKSTHRTPTIEQNKHNTKNGNVLMNSLRLAIHVPLVVPVVLLVLDELKAKHYWLRKLSWLQYS
jgi:hypothetical protein